MSKVSLAGVKVVDVHAHPFAAPEEKETPLSFLRKLSLSVNEEMFVASQKADKAQPVPNSNMWIQILLRNMAKYLSCEETLESIVEARNKKAADYGAYTKELFGDVQLEGAIMDFGYPQPPLKREDFEKLSGSKIWEISRIETIMVEFGKEGLEFNEFVRRYRERLSENLSKPGVVGLKTIIAYRSGLEIMDMNEEEARKGYKEFVENDRSPAKSLRDYCFHIAMEECTAADKFMHIHTGIGDGEVVITKASPSYLLDTLRLEKYKDTKVHLVHGGYPWMEEAAFIVSILPNVYMDISLQNPFTGHGVERIISQVLELAPFGKVMYGSDAFTVPEMNWMGAKLFVECFERVLNDWVEKDYMDSEKARYIGEMILYRNFENIYKTKL
ncbi:putative metal-dependent hydrolase [Planococcus sp. PAMC 21323]|uniref:amidohydrolase family protein n=1 Tax=Planococcus sp. PAMC 21323 TaxID=1526927 RepID=UPI0005720924|nr:amidohydrolase family protein [Planococcus sp. PAMC 21323]AIY06818.1 putative metal-dependent hydrolase [Planococcus sp. PAMC 21323]